MTLYYSILLHHCDGDAIPQTISYNIQAAVHMCQETKMAQISCPGSKKLGISSNNRMQLLMALKFGIIGT